MSERAEYPTDGTRPYVCNACGASGVKLWRDSNRLACWCDLFCGACAAKHAGDAEPDDDGKTRLVLLGVDHRTDQVGGLVPAIPADGNTTFWGYCSVPEERVAWWKSLPTKAPAKDAARRAIRSSALWAAIEILRKKDFEVRRAADTIVSYAEQQSVARHAADLAALRPPAMTVLPDDGAMVSAAIEAHFACVLRQVGCSTEKRKTFAEVRPVVLHPYGRSGQIQQSDDRLTMLLFRGTCIASVLERRTEFNFVEVKFSTFLDAHTLQRIAARKGCSS